MAKHRSIKMRKTLNITKAVSDETRVRALMMLEGGELCVCQIIETLGLAPSTISKHMSILKQADLVESRKCGRWIHYRLAEETDKKAGAIITWLTASLKRDKIVQNDRKKLKEILKLEKETICKKMYHC